MKSAELSDLFTLSSLEPPAGDLGIKPGVSAVRSVWGERLDGESDAPDHRIFHQRTLRLHAPARLRRLGVRETPGYHKCGSHVETDWVTAFRLLVWNGEGWEVIREERDLSRPGAGSVHWFDLGGVETSGVIVEARRCALDPWWPSWNLATGAFVLEGEAPAAKPLRGERAAAVNVRGLDGLPGGVSAALVDGEVRYRTRFHQIGFRLGRPGFSFLSLDDEGLGRTSQNLLRLPPGISFQGLFLHPVGTGPTMARSIRYAVEGSTRVEGNVVEYSVDVPELGEAYRLRWEVGEDRLALRAERRGEKDLRAWESSAWSIGFDARVSATSGIGRLCRKGETGLMHLPAIIHAPAFGSLEVRGGGMWRTESFRPADLAVHELKLGEVPQAEGDVILQGGTHVAELSFSRGEYGIPLVSGTPVPIARAIRRCTVTSMSYRPDTATLSNNGNSMHCPLCMDNWSALALRIGPLLPELSAVDLLRDSIERWLDGGPGYGSGGLMNGGTFHLAEDEYIMTGTAGLLGVAEFLAHAGTTEWVARYEPRLADQLDRMRARDVDGDGLVESIYRLGISGEHQWATCWYDVLSFGWKCAFSNALLYPALLSLSESLPRLGRPALARGLAEWAGRLKESYLPAFFNPATGWCAGWRCKEGKLHDHAFITVNGAAIASGVIDAGKGREIMERLLAEARRVGMPEPVYGLPASLWPIPDSDCAEIQHGFPFGYYGNGGITTAQSRHVVAALYRVGMREEADRMLETICGSLADGRVVGGAKSGIDGRGWDGWPCGYEGLLTDQFGILAVAMERYGARPTR